MRKLSAIMAATLAVMLLLVMVAPVASAASVQAPYVYLYDDGEEVAGATCDWYAQIKMATYAVNDGDWDLNVSVLMVFHNGTEAGTDEYFNVTVAVSDGTTSVSTTVAIDTSDTLQYYVVVDEVKLATLDATNNGTITYTLANGTDLDEYVQTGFVIESHEATAVLWAIFPLLISLVVLTMVFGALGGMFAAVTKSTTGKTGKKSGKKTKKRKTKKRRRKKK